MSQSIVKQGKNKSHYIARENIKSFAINPWAETLTQTMKKGTKITGFASRNVSVVDSQTGEIEETTFLGTRKVVDQEEFVKFFGAGVVATFDLSKTARDVFQIILHGYLNTNTIGKDRMDQMYINYKTMEDLGYKRTRKTFTNGLNELMQTQFMAPMKEMPHWYWLNPTYFIKGDRVVLMKEFRLRKSRQEIMEEAGQQRLAFD